MVAELLRGISCSASPDMQCWEHVRVKSSSVRIDAATHRELKRLSASLGASLGATIALAVRRLRQDQMATELSADLSASESAWLSADLR